MVKYFTNTFFTKPTYSILNEWKTISIQNWHWLNVFPMYFKEPEPQCKPQPSRIIDIAALLLQLKFIRV